MGAKKGLRVRIGTRLSLELRSRLSKYCDRSGIKERAVIEDALNKYLHGTDDTTLILRRFDRIERELAHDRRDLELLSEAFGQYMRVWFAAHAPAGGDAGRAKAAAAAETTYKQFVQHLGKGFTQGRRFVEDVPLGPSGDEDDS